MMQTAKFAELIAYLAHRGLTIYTSHRRIRIDEHVQRKNWIFHTSEEKNSIFHGQWRTADESERDDGL